MRSGFGAWATLISGALVAAAAAGPSHADRAAARTPPTDVPTWSKDVAPIVQKHCQTCHRPGEAGPFPLLTYQDARRRADKIRAAVADRVMPPWFADPHYGTFSNAMGLSASERDAILRWADGGVPEGDPRHLPAPIEWVDGWGIGQPDMVVELPQPFDVPAHGVVEYQHVIVPTHFTEDRWIQAAEVRPSERSVVHHLIAFVREPKSNWFRSQPAGVFFTAPKVSTDHETEVGALPSDFLVGYAPGQPPEVLEPGQGKLIKAGSDIVFQLHYTPHGHAVRDRTRLGIVFAKRPPNERVLTVSAVNDTFRIPPGHPDYRVDASFEVGADVTLASLHPHMHGRGKDFEYRAVFPDGRTDILLRVPRFDWHWQQWYTLAHPIRLPKGTRIDCTAHFDNSAANPEAADPTKEVRWGDQSWDEMMIGFINLVFDASMPVDRLFAKKPKAEIAAGTRRIIVLAEPGQTIHQPFADAALRWLEGTAAKEGFAIDYIRTTDPIDDAYLSAHDLFVQVNYPPYRWTPVAEIAFRKAMEQGTIGWVGFHHASLLGRFDGFEMSPFFHQFMGHIVFKSYIPDFATGTVRVEDAAHPLFAGLPASFPIENDEWYTYDRSPRPDVHVLANVDEDSYLPARSVKMGDHPVIWTNPRYAARNVYFQFGHKPELFENRAFTTMFLNAIRWAAAR
jgi:type 1 glutamine amidotransferase/mono/diheme cytochrome c family protein